LSLLRTGQLKSDSKGVTKVAENRYRLDVTYSVPDDEIPLPADVTPPVPRIQPVPVYPYDLRQKNTAGGVLLRLTIDEKARVKKVEVVRASHPAFASCAVQAVEKWVIGKPALKDGKPAAITLFQLLTFETHGGPSAPLGWRISPEPCLSPFTVLAL